MPGIGNPWLQFSLLQLSECHQTCDEEACIGVAGFLCAGMEYPIQVLECPRILYHCSVAKVIAVVDSFPSFMACHDNENVSKRCFAALWNAVNSESDYAETRLMHKNLCDSKEYAQNLKIVLIFFFLWLSPCVKKTKLSCGLCKPLKVFLLIILLCCNKLGLFPSGEYHVISKPRYLLNLKLINGFERSAFSDVMNTYTVS